MKYSYFTDIEEVAKWTYDHSERFYDKNNPDSANYNSWGTTGTVNNIRKMKSYPNGEILKEVNVEEINIAELLLCINNVKDATRPTMNKDDFTMTSTSKKVMNILLLGRILDGESVEGCFVVKQETQPLYNYFDKLYHLSDSPNKGVKSIRYFPGRTVSFTQICHASERFKNSITRTGIWDGLIKLVEYGFVECVDEKNELYKLDFSYCKNFLEKYMSGQL